MRNTRLVGLVMIILAGATMLAQAQVSVQFDKKYDYAKVKTFAVQLATSWGNPLGERAVLEDVERAVATKGWVKTDPPQADVTVLVHGATESKKRLNAMYSGGGWRFGGMGSGTIKEEDYKVGTLVVDIYDTNSKELLYRGVAQGELSGNPEKNEKKVEKALTKMFKGFPPTPKKP